MGFSKWMLSLVVLLAAPLAFLGCPADDDSESEFAICSQDTDCLETEVCHPQGKICVPSCETDEDCPDTEKTCAQVAGATKSICTCESDELCSSEGTEVCSIVDNVCTPKCAADEDCSFAEGRTCDTATGQCKLSGVCTTTADCNDASKVCDAGVCVAKCTETSCPTEKPVCNAEGICEALPACDATKPVGTNGGVDICNYGEVCVNNVCAPAAGSCQAATSRDNSVSGSSPVVWNVRQDGTHSDPDCPAAGNTVQVFRGNWYDPQGDVATSSVYQKIRYVTSSGNMPGSGGNTFRNTSISKSNDNSGEFTFELCKTSDIVSNAQGVLILDNASHESNVGCFAF